MLTVWNTAVTALADIDAALDRSGPVAIERLEPLPTAELCMECQREERAATVDPDRWRCVVLSDRERATWEEIQDQVLAEDPGFARIFDAPAQLPPSPSPVSVAERRVHRILVWCAAVLGVLLLVAGSVGGALLVAMVGVALLMERR
jgi:hypothetical protein